MSSIKLILFVLSLMIISSGCGETGFEGATFVEVSSAPVPSETKAAETEEADASVSDQSPDPAEDSGGEVASAQTNPQQPGDLKDDPGLNSIEVTRVAAGLSHGTVNLLQGYTELKFEMGYEKVTAGINKSYDQLNRQKLTKNFTQGTAGTDMSENFTQNNLGIIDILAVVDNSGSMSDEHNKLKNELPDLISEIKDTNWKIKVVSTDSGDNCLTGDITGADGIDAAKAKFTQMIDDLGTSGSGNERGVYKANIGLKCNDNWIRKQSSLVVLIVSDEDNCSNGSCSGNDSNDLPATLIATMGSQLADTTRVVKKDAKIYGLIRIPDDDQCNSQDSIEGPVYQNLIVNSSDGYVGSICDADYTTTFKRISSDMKNQLTPVFELQQIPVLSSLKVYVNDVLQEIGDGKDVSISGKTLTFKVAPAAGAQIKVDYRFGATERFKEFDLAEAPGKIERVTLTKTGGQPEVQQAGQHFNLDGSKIVFVAQPDDNAKVTVEYRQSSPALLETFVIDKSATPESIVVKVNNEKVSHVFDLEKGQVRPETVPADEAKVEVTYEVVSQGDKITAFSAEKDPGNVFDLTAWDDQSGDMLNVVWENGTFKFQAEAFVEGRQIKVRYRSRVGDDPLSFNLPYEISSEQIQLTLLDKEGVEKSCDVENIYIQGKTLNLDCDMSNLAGIRVKYLYQDASEQVFDLQTGPLENVQYSVWIDDVKIEENKDFTIKSDGSVSINRSLAPLAKIRFLIERVVKS